MLPAQAGFFTKQQDNKHSLVIIFFKTFIWKFQLHNYSQVNHWLLGINFAFRHDPFSNWASQPSKDAPVSAVTASLSSSFWQMH